MQISIIVAVSLAALSFGMLVLAVTARAFAFESHKPHYALLFRQWTRALALLVALLVVHVATAEFVGRRGFLDVLGACLASFPFGFAMAGLAGVGLVTAGGHALGALHVPYDYLSRSGFRIGAMVALVGLALLPLGFGPSWFTVACSVVLVLAIFAALSLLLWRRHAREAPWQLRAFVGVAPAGLLLLVLLAALVVLPLPPLVRGEDGVVTIVDLVLLAVAAIALRRLAVERPDLRSLDARLTEACHGTREATYQPLAVEGPRHAGR